MMDFEILQDKVTGLWVVKANGDWWAYNYAHMDNPKLTGKKIVLPFTFLGYDVTVTSSKSLGFMQELFMKLANHEILLLGEIENEVKVNQNDIVRKPTWED